MKCEIGKFSESYSGGTPSVRNIDYYGGNIPFIRSAEINANSTELFLTEEGIVNSSAKMVQRGDILYALYGATSGEVGISRINGAINQAILAIKLNENKDDSMFLMQWLQKQKAQIINTFIQGGQGNLSGQIVKNLIVSRPCIEEQKQIGAFFNQLNNTITVNEHKLFNSILSR
ncbi:restriction endonuclease subunit S [Lactococcus raffinolactis]|uniref:restriction endonuclease subunit S n=1 Tax=Pseudolactococcus raffinolactis TaxID=1366 RepID=UPI001FDA74F5|nr:restriction endonuclease subunit S [Lactococcus raffinolactis]